ncbi:MAG: 3-oxoacyl-ACP reductase FabG [Bacillota bacterium]
MGEITWNFTGKHALITGGSRGIGKEVVIKLAEAGAVVYFTYSNSEEKALNLCDEMSVRGLEVFPIKCDFTIDKDIDVLLNKFVSNEVPSIDMLINNAGITIDALLYHMNDKQWTNVLQVNLTALFKISRGLVRPLALSKGSIVNVSSVTGLLGAIGQVNYAASKAGVIGFSKALSKELGPLGIRVNCVAPGYTETDMVNEFSGSKRKKITDTISLRRFGTSEEVADVILFLLSSQSSYVTGEVITISGGMI